MNKKIHIDAKGDLFIKTETGLVKFADSQGTEKLLRQEFGYGFYENKIPRVGINFSLPDEYDVVVDEKRLCSICTAEEDDYCQRAKDCARNDDEDIIKKTARLVRVDENKTDNINITELVTKLVVVKEYEKIINKINELQQENARYIELIKKMYNEDSTSRYHVSIFNYETIAEIKKIL